MPFDPTISDRALAALYALAGGAMLAIWEGEGGAKALPQVAGKTLPAPILTLSLTTSWGANRMVCAFRRPQTVADVDFVAAGGAAVASGSLPARPQTLSAEALLGGLSPGEQVRALRFLLQSCRAAFELGGHPLFVRLCREAVSQLAPTPSPLEAEADITDGLLLCAGRLPQRFGRVSDAIILTDNLVRRNAHLPAEYRGGSFELALEASGVEHQLTVVLFGNQSMACRTIDAGAPRLRLLRWLEKARPRHESREYVTACLSRMAGDPVAEATLREMQLLFPLEKAGLAPKDKPLGGEIELAVSHHAGGLFVSGWLHDPYQLIDGITAVSASGRRTPLSGTFHRFPRADVAQRYRDAEASGFITYVPGSEGGALSFQHRFELALRSGEVLHMAAPLQPGTAVEARNAVLGSLPTPHLTDSALVEAIAPAAASLHGHHMAGRKEAERIDFGTPLARPAVSVVVPLYKVLDFLRFQVSAFAVDRAMADVELIYVLDSPEQRAQLEHLLRGLHALYGLPLTLLVMSSNFGFAAASNAGAAIARAPAVLFLNSDVIPDVPGWLGHLRAALDADDKVAAVGPKLLFDDQSLQHAGMYFDRDLTGKWYNLHYHKGLPRDFAPACKARSVPAVTGACTLVRRAIIERLGGFSEDYIIGDYEDSDLCLRLREAGHEIAYVPSAELYHLERQSIRHHVGYTRSIAASYNRHLHSERWSPLMEALAAQPGAAPRRPGKRRRVAA